MSGHSKWATTKHQKAAKDARRGKMFAKLIKSIEVAARTGGGDPAGNPTLADAIVKAKSTSVPSDNIDRAIKRGSGELGEAANYQEVTYEAYGPSGVAILVECLTDNRNRAASDVRVAITRNGGALADPGSVVYQFNRKGVVLVTKTTDMGEDDVLAAVLDAGAEEVNDIGEGYEVVSEATDLHAVRQAVADSGFELTSAELSWLANVNIPLAEDAARKVLRLIDALEELDDVQNVWANFDLSDEVLEAVEAQV